MEMFDRLYRIGRKAVFEPRILLRNLNSVYHSRGLRREHNTSGVDVLNEEWDNLIILDACRFDIFSDNFSDLGKFRSQTSRGGTTLEFLRGNFSNKKLHDTVYITANPMLRRYSECINVEFHQEINVWMNDGWDEELKTVRAEAVTEKAIEAAEDYDDKRIIVHYIQPHFPFVRSSTKFDKRYPDPDKPTNMWEEILSGRLDISEEVIWEAYTNNLRYVMDSVGELLPQLDGKSVITSDHGNIVGERSFPIPIKEYGHPPSTYINELVQVPWLELPFDQRRRIVSESPVESIQNEAVEDQSVAEQLEHLGYV